MPGGGVVHSFTGGVAEAESLLGMGLYIGAVRPTSCTHHPVRHRVCAQLLLRGCAVLRKLVPAPLRARA